MYNYLQNYEPRFFEEKSDWNWEATSAISSIVLTIIIIVAGAIQFIRQQKLQKDIANKESNLVLYKERLSVYKSFVLTGIIFDETYLEQCHGAELLKFFEEDFQANVRMRKELVYSYNKAKLVFNNCPKVISYLKKLYLLFFDISFVNMQCGSLAINDLKQQEYEQKGPIRMTEKVIEQRKQLYQTIKIPRAEYMRMLESEEFEAVFEPYLCLKEI